MSTPSTTTYSLASVPVADATALHDVFAGVARVNAANNLALLGHTDLVDAPEASCAAFLDRGDADKLLLVALDAPVADAGGPGLPEVTGTGAARVLGYAEASLPTGDNLDLAEVFVEVHPDAARAGLGTVLATALEEEVRARGRHTLMSWTAHRDEAGPGSAGALVAPTGVGALRREDPVTRFALSRGYALEQTERHSQLDVPVAEEVLAPLRERAVAASGGYEVLTWVGRTPEEHVQQMARLRQRMSVDVPMGALALEEEAWDAERVRRGDERAARTGRTVLVAVARHLASGDLVAYSVLICPRENPVVAWQGDTLVHGEHRGHRLGMLVKVANLEALAAARPSTQRVHTWNAGENQWMLAINVALGFGRVATEGAWQKRLTD